jgi:hypothetical protein
LQRLAVPGKDASRVSTEEFVPRQLSLSELESFPSLDWFEIAPTLTPTMRSSLERILETQNGSSIPLEEAFALAC